MIYVALGAPRGHEVLLGATYDHRVIHYPLVVYMYRVKESKLSL